MNAIVYGDARVSNQTTITLPSFMPMNEWQREEVASRIKAARSAYAKAVESIMFHRVKASDLATVEGRLRNEIDIIDLKMAKCKRTLFILAAYCKTTGVYSPSRMGRDASIYPRFSRVEKMHSDLLEKKNFLEEILEPSL